MDVIAGYLGSLGSESLDLLMLALNLPFPCARGASSCSDPVLNLRSRCANNGLNSPSSYAYHAPIPRDPTQACLDLDPFWPCNGRFPPPLAPLFSRSPSPRPLSPSARPLSAYPKFGSACFQIWPCDFPNLKGQIGQRPLPRASNGDTISSKRT